MIEECILYFLVCIIIMCSNRFGDSYANKIKSSSQFGRRFLICFCSHTMSFNQPVDIHVKSSFRVLLQNIYSVNQCKIVNVLFCSRGDPCQNQYGRISVALSKQIQNPTIDSIKVFQNTNIIMCKQFMQLYIRTQTQFMYKHLQETFYQVTVF